MHRFLAFFALTLAPAALHAGSLSFVGTLASSTDVFETTFTLTSTATIGLQTWGFGGSGAGTNAAGAHIAGGGTDPFLAVFAGTGSGATILTDGLGNPFATSLDQANYGNPNFLGCPPATAPVIDGAPQCGDITMTLPSLAPGTYTVLLSDGQYVPGAYYDNGTLGEPFSDFTGDTGGIGGTFCNIVIGVDLVACPNTSGAYAFDITGLPTSTSPVPEPAFGGSLGGTALLGLALLNSFHKRKPK
jgi:hypothetical protein